ncbi:flavoprotein-like protein [Lipomyces kononenkoae]|uniref:Flavoprotein-like protein n=1 Tax=Lipomyces kononenkoae TaxID=34357 RepID=A0ACC3SSQ5_LIPKO
MAVRPLVYIIVSSTRVTRIGPDVAKWIHVNAQAAFPSLEFKIIDIINYDLPLHSLEPHIPMTGLYTQPGTLEWSSTILQASAFLFVTPQRNALDYLKKEWYDKPAGIVSYSHRGGDRAAVALATVLAGSLRMRLASPPYACIKSSTVFDNGSTKTEGPEVEESWDIVKEVISGIVKQLGGK